MSQITVRGGKPLNGRIELKGAKNLVTKAMVAALLGETPSVLKDVPFISDVDIVSRLLQLHGVAITHSEDGVMSLDPSDVASARMVDIDAHAGRSRIHPPVPDLSDDDYCGGHRGMANRARGSVS